MAPIRCFTCGSVIGDKYEEYWKRVEAGEDPGKVLDDIGVTRYCCRRMIISHAKVMNEVLYYYEVRGRKKRRRM
jgi:DNA-directed RNA polymerase subunit N